MIHFSSSSFFSIQKKPSSPSKSLANPVHEQQSQNISLCENTSQSLQGLMKKDEMETSTRNTQWSETQKETALSTELQNDKINCQNQNPQKIISFTTIWKFYDQTTQALEIQQQKKKYAQKICSIKKSILENRNRKIKNLRNLLPYFYNVDIPKEIKKMLKIADQIDKHLVEKKAAEYTDNIHNILRTLFQEQEMSSMWSMVKKMMFICEDYYKIRIDPLKNLCLGFRNKKDIKLSNRKQRLRKTVVDYYQANQDSFQFQILPESIVQPVKTTRFYPQNLNIQTKIIEEKLNTEYVNKLKESVKIKEQKIQNKQNQSQSATPKQQTTILFESSSQLKLFCEEITKIYASKKVFHMYKVSLIQNLRKTQAFSLQKIFYYLKYIQEEGLFLEVLIKSGCQIFRINEKQKDSLVEISELKMNQKKN